MMGSPADEPFRKENEGPQRKVRISPFFMGEVEVTWDQFWAFYGETMSEGRTPPALIYANNTREDVDAVSGPTPPFGFPDQGWGMGERPAITMTHYAAETFCQWLSLKTGKKYRLPTEAEWEYAARGGKYSQNYKYAGSDNLNQVAWYNDNCGKMGLRQVATRQPNELGLYDMSGNVWEWCCQIYNQPDSPLLIGLNYPQELDYCVIRGGSYTSEKEACEVSYNDGVLALDQGVNHGLRLVLAPRIK